MNVIDLLFQHQARQLRMEKCDSCLEEFRADELNVRFKRNEQDGTLEDYLICDKCNRLGWPW